jgi:hypothetical protein
MPKNYDFFNKFDCLQPTDIGILKLKIAIIGNFAIILYSVPIIS